MNDKINLKSRSNSTRVFSVYPTYRGFGFVIFEGATKPIDWGNVTVQRRDNILTIKKIKSLINYYQPDVLVTEDYSGKGSRRNPRIQSLIDSIKQLEKANKLIVKTYSRADISNVFEPFGASTKYEISQTIAKFLPVFKFLTPPKRKPWMSEDSRMAIFDAAALVLTHFYLED
ncbi:hypothetical protein GOV13_05115 [Candidatus Pacearchaeota archaeon]|nr:hypothetical protein [Candidatus Pacearchaeota archaeon]